MNKEYKGYDLKRALGDLMRVKNQIKNLPIQEAMSLLKGWDLEEEIRGKENRRINRHFVFTSANYKAKIREFTFYYNDEFTDREISIEDNSVFINNDLENKEPLEISYSELQELILQEFYEKNKNNKYNKIGMLIYDDNNNLVGVIKDRTEQGYVFKDQEAYETSLDKICYIGEYGSINDGYTKQDILDIANGNEEQADIVFDMVDWQGIETLFDELEFSDFEEESEEEVEWFLLKMKHI